MMNLTSRIATAAYRTLLDPQASPERRADAEWLLARLRRKRPWAFAIDAAQVDAIMEWAAAARAAQEAEGELAPVLDPDESEWSGSWRRFLARMSYRFGTFGGRRLT